MCTTCHLQTICLALEVVYIWNIAYQTLMILLLQYHKYKTKTLVLYLFLGCIYAFTISVALGYFLVSNMKLLKPVDQPESISTAPTCCMAGRNHQDVYLIQQVSINWGKLPLPNTSAPPTNALAPHPSSPQMVCSPQAPLLI